jgi:hypothetical protein
LGWKPIVLTSVLENKKERLEAKAERQAEALQHKREKVEEFKKTQKATEQSLADARTKEADEKIKEKAAMVSEMLTLGNYGDAVNDLLNLDDKDWNEQWLEQWEWSFVAIVQDRIQDSEALTNATPNQLAWLKTELESRIKSIREAGNKKVEAARSTDYTRTSKQIERSWDKDIRKQERKLVRLLREVQNHIDNPGEQTA